MLLFSGCAFGLSGPDPDRPRSQQPKCDTGKNLVALDGTVAAVAGAFALSLAGDTEPAVALLPLSIGAIYAAGAIRGNSNVNKCRAAMAEYESYSAARETLRPPVEEVEPGREEPDREPLASRGSAPPQPLQPSVQPLAPASAPAPLPATVPAQPPDPVVAPAPVAAPARAAAAPPAAKPGKQPPAAKREPADDWSDFWREVE